MRPMWRLGLILFICVENVLIVSLCTQAKLLREDVEFLNDHLDSVDRSLERVQKNLEDSARLSRQIAEEMRADGGP